MANYIGYTRTNYFSVTDEEKFRQIIANAYSSADKIEVFEDKTDGNVKYAFGCYGVICGTRELSDDDDDEGD